MKKIVLIMALLPIAALIIFLAIRPKMSGRKCRERAIEALEFCEKRKLNREICIFVDYSLHSGVDRLMVWSFEKNKPLYSCLVSHGRGSDQERGAMAYVKEFGNVPESNLTSLGKAMVGERYKGSYGTSYRLHGLEKSNSNMQRRAIVLHGWRAVRNFVSYPLATVGGLGCPAVSHKAMSELDSYLKDRSRVLIWSYN